uniref:Tyrosine-protein kinase ephrin type A/B receptor-like domain-containing protein n=1 Tax=Noctiluca scintillans TaxID=2966 RepID=A0A7S1F7Y9_NOCSC
MAQAHALKAFRIDVKRRYGPASEAMCGDGRGSNRCVLQTLLLFAVFLVSANSLTFPICIEGECVNCRSCNTECDSCTCSSVTNTCCCTAPYGHYARGNGAVECPGGTYNSDDGAWSCVLCPIVQYYDIAITGATQEFDCTFAVCGTTSVNCWTPAAISQAMTERDVSLRMEFCTLLSIGEDDCSWISPDAAPRYALSVPVQVLLMLLFLWSNGNAHLLS